MKKKQTKKKFLPAQKVTHIPAPVTQTNCYQIHQYVRLTQTPQQH